MEKTEIPAGTLYGSEGDCCFKFHLDLCSHCFIFCLNLSISVRKTCAMAQSNPTLPGMLQKRWRPVQFPSPAQPTQYTVQFLCCACDPCHCQSVHLAHEHWLLIVSSATMGKPWSLLNTNILLLFG